MLHEHTSFSDLDLTLLTLSPGLFFCWGWGWGQSWVILKYFFSFEWESVSICCSGFVVFLCELLCSGTVCSVCFLQHRWCSILCCTMRCTAVLCTLVSCQVFHRVKRREGVRACEEVDKMWSYKVSPVTARPIPSRSAWNARSCKLHRLASSVGVTSLTDHHGWNKDAFHQIW